MFTNILTKYESHKPLKNLWDFSTRILLVLLLPAEAQHVAYDLGQTRDPLFGLLSTGGHQVQVFLAALEDDGEAAFFIGGLCVFVEPLRLSAHTHRVDVINGDCLGRRSEFI